MKVPEHIQNQPHRCVHIKTKKLKEAQIKNNTCPGYKNAHTLVFYKKKKEIADFD